MANMSRILITGANGHLGRRLIPHLVADNYVDAIVRSERAGLHLRRALGAHPRVTIHQIDPSQASALAAVAASCDQAVHLIGTIKETATNSYFDSHERCAQALLDAALASQITQIVYISISGASAASASQCLRARANVESLFAQAQARTTIIRVPMVLGEKDRASRALFRRAAARYTFVFRAASLEQPIYAGDVIDAVHNALNLVDNGQTIFELAGPESLARRDLILRAAKIIENKVHIISLPITLGYVLAWLLEIASSKPALTREMLRVLDHDDDTAVLDDARALGLTLTDLDRMLEKCRPPPSNQETTR